MLPSLSQAGNHLAQAIATGASSPGATRHLSARRPARHAPA